MERLKNVDVLERECPRCLGTSDKSRERISVSSATRLEMRLLYEENGYER